MAFETEQVRLSMRSPETGNYLTANVYTLDGIQNADGTPRQMSIGQLVMAICLQRATGLERDIIELMSNMNLAARKLEMISTIEAALAEQQDGNPTANIKTSFSAIQISGDQLEDIKEFAREMGMNPDSGSFTWPDFLAKACDVKNIPIITGDVSPANMDKIISAMETAMDDLNTLNQSDLIELQSLTNKRDQSYDLISAMLKSFNSVQNSILANYR